MSDKRLDTPQANRFDFATYWTRFGTISILLLLLVVLAVVKPTAVFTATSIPQILRQVGFPEIPRQPDAEQPGTAHGDLGIAGKIMIDLQPEQQRAQNSGKTVGRLKGKKAIHIRRDKVGDTDLPEKTAQQQFDARPKILLLKRPHRRQLGQQIVGPLDRPRHQLREEGHEQRAL